MYFPTPREVWNFGLDWMKLWRKKVCGPMSGIRCTLLLFLLVSVLMFLMWGIVLAQLQLEYGLNF